jgi:hypothetical protein
MEVTQFFGGAVAQLGARLDGIEEVVGSNPIGSTNFSIVRSEEILYRTFRRDSLGGLKRSAKHPGSNLTNRG